MHIRSVALAALTLAGCRAAPEGGPERGPELGLERGPERGPVEIVLAHENDLDPAPHVEVRGLPVLAEPAEGWGSLFTVRVAGARRPDGSPFPPLLGRYEARDGVLLFEPRFALAPDLPYRAVLDRSRLPGADADEPPVVETLVVRRPEPPVPPAVEAVHPSARPLPANLLKLYLHFSRPMARGFAYEHTHILDEGGARVEAPFLELGDELWSPGATRLTLLIDPGRIKRGLVPHEQLGPVLAPDRTYTLLIEAGWPGADGALLATDLRIELAIGGADAEQPDPQAWTFEPPRAFTREPLAVALDEPLDHALLQHMLRVVPLDGPPLAGAVSVSHGESRWTFVPDRPWTPAVHRIVVDPDLEDLAGNSVGRPFEVHMEGGPRAGSEAAVELLFQPLP